VTYKQTAINDLLKSDQSGRLAHLHNKLLILGLNVKTGKQTDTFLYEIADSKKKKVGIVAFRPGIYPIFSFPRTFWINSIGELDKEMIAIERRHFIDTDGFVSPSQYSLRQLKINEDMFESLSAIVSGIIARKVSEIKNDA